jgi:hypothetical protein
MGRYWHSPFGVTILTRHFLGEAEINHDKARRAVSFGIYHRSVNGSSTDVSEEQITRSTDHVALYPRR